MLVKDFMSSMKYAIDNKYISEDDELFIMVNDKENGNFTGWKIKHFAGLTLPKAKAYKTDENTGFAQMSVAIECRETKLTIPYNEYDLN